MPRVIPRLHTRYRARPAATACQRVHTERPLLASPLALLSGEGLIIMIAGSSRQRSLLASPLALLSSGQLSCSYRGRFLPSIPRISLDAHGWAWTFSFSPRAARSVGMIRSARIAESALARVRLPLSKALNKQGTDTSLQGHSPI